MAKDNNYQKLQLLGVWLEDLLAPKLEPWKIKELFERAVTLIGLQYKINYTHPAFKFLKEVTERKEDWSNLRLGILEGAEIAKPIIQELKSTIQMLTFLFRFIYWKEQPWEITIKEILETRQPDEEEDNFIKEPFDIFKESVTLSKEPDKSIRDKLNSIQFRFSRWFRFIDTQRIDELYSQIGEKLIFQENGLKKVKVLLDVTKVGRIVPLTTTPSDQNLPFRIFASRIFFDFLLSGGQNYFSFCKNCERFIIAERKGRRQFCSGRCRVAYKRKKTSTIRI